MNIFGIGLPEMAVIAAIALIVFGPKRLPELGRTLGRTLKGFQSASQGFEEQFRSALDSPGSDSSASPAAATTVASTAVERPVAAADPGDASPSSSTAPDGPAAG